ncbi:hypothetical protein K1719_037023 [Acacia pycnantha]|nr:hypothetical protein K1719_037023 [Acacia pycnantha]
MANPEAAQRRRRLAIIGVSSFLLVAMAVAVTLGVSMNQSDSESSQPKDNNKSHVSDSMKAVTELCRPTEYKKECEDSIKSEAGNTTTDPKELIKIAFNITIRSVGESLQKTRLIHEIEKEPRSKMALDSCMHLMALSIGEFRKSVQNMGSFDLTDVDDMLMNLKVWISGAITYQQTCLDGFQNTTSPAGKQMQDVLKLTMKHSSNILAIINDLANSLAQLNISSSATSRHLLQDVFDFPVWAQSGLRRLLATGKLRPNEGVYHEYVHVMTNMTRVVMIGDGAHKTRITGNRNFVDGIGTFRTATVAVDGDFFVAMKIGFENSAGPEKHQAVALRVQGDMAVLYKCAMDGYQDTLYAHAMRQFYRDCTISGTVDFIFGDAVSVFQNCTFVVRKPLEEQQCIVTAQGRKDRHQPTGIVIQGGSIVADSKFYADRLKNKVYLARPWKIYSRTIFMETFMDDLIDGDGFLPWEGTLGLETCYYAEYNNSGPGSDKSKRTKWGGIKNITPQQANTWMPLNFFKGDKWIKITRIPYTASSWTS